MPTLCDQPARYMCTWLPDEELRQCEHHTRHMQNVADAMGHIISVRPLTLEEILEDSQCAQKVAE